MRDILFSSHPIHMDPPTLHLIRVTVLMSGKQTLGEAGNLAGFQQRFRAKIQGQKEKATPRQNLEGKKRDQPSLSWE